MRLRLRLLAAAVILTGGRGVVAPVAQAGPAFGAFPQPSRRPADKPEPRPGRAKRDR